MRRQVDRSNAGLNCYSHMKLSSCGCGGDVVDQACPSQPASIKCCKTSEANTTAAVEACVGPPLNCPGGTNTNCNNGVCTVTCSGGGGGAGEGGGDGGEGGNEGNGEGGSEGGGVPGSTDGGAGEEGEGNGAEGLNCPNGYTSNCYNGKCTVTCSGGGGGNNNNNNNGGAGGGGGGGGNNNNNNNGRKRRRKRQTGELCPLPGGGELGGSVEGPSSNSTSSGDCPCSDCATKLAEEAEKMDGRTDWAFTASKTPFDPNMKDDWED